MTLPLIDAHCHLADDNELLTLLKNHRIPAMINCQSPTEWAHNKAITADAPFLQLSFGIHPWDTDKLTFEECLIPLNEASFIGEIGLDNLWTEIPLNRQMVTFKQQLAYAFETKKPVILHTKDREKEVLDTIKSYPNRYLVHWYGTLDYLDEYLALGCYFTIGPSLENEPYLVELMTRVPFDRLLMESDGLEAMKWAHQTTTVDYIAEQEKVLHIMGKVFHQSPESVGWQLRHNFHNWIGGNKKKNA